MIVIVFLTFDRLEVALKALHSVGHNLVTSEEVHFHLADDGSSQEYRDTLLAAAKEYYGANVSVSNSERSGYGGNCNLASQTVHLLTDILLPLEDDWELVRELNVDPIISVLRGGVFGCVRMGYIGYTQELRGKFVSAAMLQWLELDPDSPERHVFAGGPRLETVEWERAVGPWPEGMEQGATEHEVAGWPAARQSVAWPIDLIHPRGDAFVHIGGEKASIEGLRERVPA